MITCIIKHNGEPNVIKFTYQALYRELKDIPGSDILVYPTWMEGLQFVNEKHRFVCFVESDCMVNSGYFSSLVGLLEKEPDKRHIAAMASATAVKVWVNKFYGYKISHRFRDHILPNREPISRSPYPIQIAYMPGAIIRLTMLRRFLDTHELPENIEDNLQQFSLRLSLGLWADGWGNGIGSRIYLNPNTTYATTENYVNEVLDFDPKAESDNMDAITDMFKRLDI